ncbi:hypothetical protein SDC9_106279 [bioreactor metagenome]|uniref:Glycosyltransferase RgtA/B/C/D-like domain-containing protein n=1 Tax=bioreactor metagenome TaxID=1076179 RepID=A0A645B205_9ZZZZ
MLKKNFKKHWILILVLLIGAFFRLYQIGDYMEFLGDQGRDVIIIKDFWQNGNLFFIGPQTSIGNMYLGPWFYYLISPALLISNFSPVGPAIFIAFLNILTIYMLYFVGNKWFSKSIGLISAFLFAISPVVIKYSNFIWNPNIMPLFSLLFIYFFFESFNSKKFHYFLYASLSFVMVINSHYLGLALLPLVGIFWLYSLIRFIQKKSKLLKPFLINSLFAFLIFILSLTPQILFDIKHQGQNIKALTIFFTQRETTVNLKAYKAIPIAPLLFDQINTRLLAGKNETVGIIVTILLFFGIFISVLKPKKQKFNFWVILGWYFSGIIALALYKQHVYDHYFAFLFPVAFLFIAILINKFKIIGIPILVLLVVFSLIENPLRYSPNYQLQHSRNLANSINQNLSQDDGKFNVTMLASYNDFRAQAPRYFINSPNLLSQEDYSSAKTLFIILDDPSKWKLGVDSDIWEINVFKDNSKYNSTSLFTSDGVQIVKLTKQ